MKQLFNDDWILNPVDGYEMFMNPAGVKQEHHVNLPYDALQLERRNADIPLGKNTGYYPYEKAIYVKKFMAPKEWHNKLVAVEFEGVYMRPMVYVNGHYAGNCVQGYMDFTVDMTPFLKIGQENELKVVCKTRMDSRWYAGLGIFRNVSLWVWQPCHIKQDGVHITTLDIRDGANIYVETEVENHTFQTKYMTVETKIMDETGQCLICEQTPLTVYGEETDKSSQYIYIADAQLWSVDRPYLYQVSVRLLEDKEEMDAFRCDYGCRMLSADARHGICINGEQILLRGACIHHDNGLLGAADIDRAEERRVQLLKKAGFNAVRSAHNPISKAFLYACDKYGMLVMDELTDMWTRCKGEWDYSTDFMKDWPNLCEAIVAKDYNHPSVILYSIGNEIQEAGTPHGAVIGRRLVKRLKELDATRLTTNSVNLMMAAQGQVDMRDMMPDLLAAGIDLSMLSGMEKMSASEKHQEQEGENEKQGMDINEIMQNLGPMLSVMVASDAVGDITEETFAAVDIAGYNYAASRYEKDGKRYPNRLIVGSETYPQDIADNWEQVKKLPHVIGDFTWTGWDYLGEAGIGATNYEGEPAKEKYPWYIAWCGDIDITGQRRPISYYREIVFGLRKEPYFAVRYPENYGKKRKDGSWDFVDGCMSWTWPAQVGKEVELEIYAPGDHAKVYINDILKADCPLEGYRSETTVPYEPGKIEIVAMKDQQVLGRFMQETADQVIEIRAIPDRSMIRADTTDLCYVEIDLVDHMGRRNPADDRELTAHVDGSGYLAGFGSAKPTSEESFLEGKFKTYQGHLLAVVRPAGVGDITLTVGGEGLPSVQISITAE